MDSCKTENETGQVLTKCPSGYCYMKSRKENGATTVVAGCFAPDTKCNKGDDPCNTAAGVEECEQCCDTNECTKNGLQNGLSNESGSNGLSATGLLVLASSVFACMLYRTTDI